MSPDKRRYSKVYRRIWNDARFRSLSAPCANGQTLFLRLLTGPELTNIPGVFSCGEAALAEALSWTLEGFREAFAEAFGEGLAKADWKSRFVFVPKAIKYNSPESPNVILSWRQTWDELPECPLKEEAYQTLKAFVEGLGEAFRKAFAEACPHPSPNQEQEQEQEQEQKREKIDMPPSGRREGSVGDPRPGRSDPPATTAPPLALAPPSEKSRSRRRPKTPMPTGFGVSAAIERMCRAEGLPNPHEVIVDFRDKTAANDYVYADWEAAFRTWMRSPITREKFRPWSESDAITPPTSAPEAAEEPKPASASERHEFLSRLSEIEGSVLESRVVR